MTKLFRHPAGPLALSLVALLTGCASVPMMGEKPDATPPKLVQTDKKDPETGRALLDWDRPGAFGKVADELKAVGDGACMAARVDLEALGYHPEARNDKGEVMPGGGFYCYPKRNGDKPDAVAPRLVPSARKGTDGQQLLAWDRPGAFGKVRETLQAKGDVACMLASIELEAIAYHPQAAGPDGEPLPGGGFYCFRKKTGDKPAEKAPHLTRLDGMLGWDRPAAFGAVPQALQARGDAVCANAGRTLHAIGYHPAALDEKGQPIPGGGYFCAVKPNASRVARA
jgi:hypothetical protein